VTVGLIRHAKDSQSALSINVYMPENDKFRFGKARGQ